MNVSRTRSHHAAPRAASLQRAVLLSLVASLLVPLLMAPSAHAGRKVWTPSIKQHVKVVKPEHMGGQLATWYGPGFWGNRTGCGSTLREDTWGIAHRTLPCGKLVWLRFNGREVAVPVVDRGPFSGANIDLTERTARHLGFQKHGTGDVKVTVLRRRIALKRL